MTEQDKLTEEVKKNTVKTKRPFWPTSKVGKIGIVTFIVYIINFGPLGPILQPLINSISSSKWFYLTVLIGITLSSLICLLVAKINKKDKATSITIALIIVGLNVAFMILFVSAELLFPHA